MRVEGRLCFEVENADSTGGEEVELLQYCRGVSVLYQDEGRDAVPHTTNPTTGIVRVK